DTVGVYAAPHRRRQGLRGWRGQALTPAPMAGGAAGSSGQRARAARSRGSLWPSFRRSIPAQAIMAPLSVQRRGGGATRRKARSRASDSRAARIWLLAATPPATTRGGV